MARWARWGRPRWLLWAALALLVLLGLRIAAPHIAAAVVRKSLHELKGGYHGDIDDVDISVLAGEARIFGMRIVKSNGRVPVPFLQIERFTLGVVRDGWKLRTALHLYRPRVSFVDAEKPAEQQWGPDFKLEELRKKLPLELSALHIDDGAVHFRKLDARPQVDARASALNVAWQNLTGCLPPGWPTCQSKLRVKAKVMDSGRLSASGSFDRRKVPNFVVKADLANLQPARLNPALREYVKVDAQGGRIDLDVRFTQRGSAQRLILVPQLYDVDIAGARSENSSWLREAAAGVAAGWFERKRGKKAIRYEKAGAGKGSWGLMDWPPKSASRDAARAPLVRAE